MVRRAPLLLIVSALAVALLGVGQGQAGDIGFKLKVGPKGGPYKPTHKIHLGEEGQHKSAFFQVRNTSEEKMNLAFGTTSEPYDGYSVKWFKGRHDVSDDVETSSEVFSIKPGAKQLFRARVKRVGGSGEETCVEASVNFGMAISYAALGVNTECSV